MFVVSSITFVLGGILFQSVSYVLVGVVLSSALVYSKLRLRYEIRDTRLAIDRRTVEEVPFAGQPAALSLDITNSGSVPARGEFEDSLPDGCELSAGTNKFSGTIPPQSGMRLIYSVTPSRRGTFTFTGVRLHRWDIHGLHTSDEFIPRKSVLGVHTAKESLHAARKLAGREHLEYPGISRSVALVMRSLEFDKIRDYMPGDRARDVHWKLLSKLDRLMTKVYVKEGAVQTMMIVDCSRSMRSDYGGRTKLDHSIDLSMQLSNVLLSSFHSVGVALVDEVSMLDRVRPAVGKHQFDRIVKVLKNTPSSAPATVPEPRSDSPGPSSVQAGTRPVVDSNKGEGFMAAVRSLGTAASPRARGMGVDGIVRNAAAHSKGQKWLFIIITDMISSKDAVIAGGRMCQRTGNRMVVLHTYDDWYSASGRELDVPEAERLYGDILDSVKVEGTLRGLGASYLRVGPADTTAGIVRSLRRSES